MEVFGHPLVSRVTGARLAHYADPPRSLERQLPSGGRAGERAQKTPKPGDLSVLGLRPSNHLTRRNRCQISSEPPARVGWALLRQTTLPGFMRPLGSKTSLTPRSSSSAFGESCRPRYARLTEPTPCSPETDPPRRNARSKSSAAARPARVVLARPVDHERRMQVAVAGVAPAAGR